MEGVIVSARDWGLLNPMIAISPLIFHQKRKFEICTILGKRSYDNKSIIKEVDLNTLKNKQVTHHHTQSLHLKRNFAHRHSGVVTRKGIEQDREQPHCETT